MHAIDVNGEEIDIEVQGNSEGAHVIYVNGNDKGNDEIGQLMEDFRQTDSKNMHYDVLAQVVKHSRETEEGREIMCESVKKYGDERVIKATLKSVKNLMKNTNFTLDQALNALGIQGEERVFLTRNYKNRNTKKKILKGSRPNGSAAFCMEYVQSIYSCFE